MKYFLTGIKGSGMTALACILKDMGHEVAGSDVSDVYFTDAKLIEKEIAAYGFSADNITSDIDCIILGNAFSYDHEEVLRANELDVIVVRYFDFIKKLAGEHFSIAIAGTNGKTTTTGLVSTMLKDEDMTYLIGDGTGVGHKDSKFFVYEACEYKNTFHNYFSKIGLINNIELDHPDFFKNQEQVDDCFQVFASQCELLVINYDNEHCLKIEHENLISFGINNEYAMIKMINIKKNKDGFTFDLTINNVLHTNYFLPFQGEHMIYNALAAIACAYALEYNIDQAIDNLALFSGTSRRFEITVLDDANDIILIDDYAHHPTAIEYTISAIKQKYPDYLVTVLFQPHTYSRTKMFLSEFAESLLGADNIYLCDIFGSVRETAGDFDISVLVDEVEKHGHKVERDLDFIDKTKQKHVIALLGAGNIDKIYIPKIKEIIKG